MLAQVQGGVKVPSALELGFPWALGAGPTWTSAWRRQVVDAHGRPVSLSAPSAT